MAHFPFCRLARELRDRIYQELGGENLALNLIVQAKDDESTAQGDLRAMAVTVLSAPATNLLLVSHDFKHEYETELRRHMALWAPGPLTARPSRVLVLEKDGSVHQFFRRIPSLVIRMWYCRKFDSSKPCTAVRDLLLPYMDNLKKITNELLYKLPDDGSEPKSPEAVLDKSAFDVHSLTPPGKTHEISLHSRHFFECRRLSLIQSFELTRKDSVDYPLIFSVLGSEGLIKLMWRYPPNVVRYRVMPTAERNGKTMGLDYTIISTDDVDLEVLMAEIEGILSMGAGQ